MHARPALLATVLVLTGCGAKMHPIQPGELTCREGACKGIQLSVDAAKKEVTFTFDSKIAKPVVRKVTAWPEERWPNLCPHGTRALKSEVFELGPDPLVLGTTTVDKPMLVSDCLGGSALDLKSADAGGEPRGPAVFRFER